MNYKIGLGYDIHRLVDGRKLILGGIEIPYIKGLLGHSDADALLHAISDAILGALGAGDIGEHFPDTDPKYHNISSSKLLEEVLGILTLQGYKIANIDTVVIAQEPNLSPFKKQIKEKVAKILQLREDCVGIKAKTQEGIGEIGAGEAIACYATVLLEKRGE